VTRPRAADDFPMIRARMEELRHERARPRAADDFAMIRARMEELRIGGQANRSGMAPRGAARATAPQSQGLTRAIRPSSIIVFAQRPFQEDRS
jgi:hypothetical protein